MKVDHAVAWRPTLSCRLLILGEILMAKGFHLVLRWIARILSILCVGTIVLFAVGEGFNPAKLKVNEWLGFIFFPFGFVIGMIMGWWKENVGGWMIICCFILFYVVNYCSSGGFPHGWAFFVFSLPGIMFLLSWYFHRRINHSAA